MASAKSRLTTGEYELLALIRAGIAENKSMEAVEEQVWRLLGFLWPIIEYIEKLI
ncbi:MAG: hypothetical protein GXC78_13105 [Chitinophagaceae bacterium]|jgi:hypothetical protein|nr:hypothetical protein [Chitinophagaceae bacterium]